MLTSRKELRKLGLISRELFYIKPKIDKEKETKACWNKEAVKPALCMLEEEPEYLCFFCGGFVCKGCSEKKERTVLGDVVDLYGSYDRPSAPFNAMVVQCCSKHNPHCKVESKHVFFRNNQN